MTGDAEPIIPGRYAELHRLAREAGEAASWYRPDRLDAPVARRDREYIAAVRPRVIAQLIDELVEARGHVWTVDARPHSSGLVGHGPDLPSWSYDPDQRIIRIWVSGSQPPDGQYVTAQGDLAELLCANLSWVYNHTRLPDPDEVEPEPDGPDDADLGDWARTLRHLAERIEETRS